ncbi:TonB-dependent receptor domain-containing protein [Pseudogemmobacter bohemicus]|uniref:TonB-dependent receptor domain-containing protein n=1 Tax=Pseudogemmobacter bohemicus TaxID=2250708 RepID=UPI000DD4BCC4|nr:TonB-dependent receptor [Pseudogemmobacter bohemicus]
MTGRNPLRAALLSSCALLFPVLAPVLTPVAGFAQGVEQTENLGTIILDTKRDVATDTGVAVTTIDQEEMDDRQASTIAELISSVPGVTLINGSTPLGGGINIRGFGASTAYGANQKVMVTIDGATQGGDEVYRIGTQLFTDPELFRSVSVIRGTIGSFEFGSGVVGGIVQLETKDASDFTGGEIGWKFRQGLNFGTNGDAISSSSIIAWQPTENFELMFNYVWHKQDDQEDGDGNRFVDTGFKDPSYALAAKYTFGGDRSQYLRLSLADTQSSERDVPYDRLSSGSSFGRVDSDNHSRTVALTYGWNPDDNDLIDLKVILSYADLEMDNRALTPSFGFNDARLRTETTKLTVKNTAIFNTGSVAHELRTGIEFSRRDRLDAPSSPGGRDNRVAVFVIDKMDFGNGLTVTPALRYETQNIKYVGSTAAFAGEYDHDELMGGLAARYEFQNGLAVFASGAYTVALPISDDFDAQNKLNGTKRYNYMEMPEKARTWEIGASYSGADVFASGDALSLKANFYTTDNWSVTSLASIKAIEVRGVELEAAYSLGNGLYGEIGANITDGDSQLYSDDRWLGRYSETPADALRLVVGKRWDRELDLSWEMVAAKRYADNSMTCTATPPTPCPISGFGVHNLRATYRPEQGILAGAELRVGIENLFDRDFRPRLATRDAPGRNIKFGIYKTF